MRSASWNWSQKSSNTPVVIIIPNSLGYNPSILHRGHRGIGHRSKKGLQHKVILEDLAFLSAHFLFQIEMKHSWRQLASPQPNPIQITKGALIFLEQSNKSTSNQNISNYIQHQQPLSKEVPQENPPVKPKTFLTIPRLAKVTKPGGPKMANSGSMIFTFNEKNHRTVVSYG